MLIGRHVHSGEQHMSRIAVWVAGIAVAACGAAESHVNGSSTALTSDVATADVIYVDVRTTAEFDQGHVRDALHIPVEELEQRWAELAAYRDRPIVLYCRTGRRSGIALDLLRARGFTMLENGGSLGAMRQRGLPIVTTRF
jgi:phage shock protein E